MDSRQEMLAGEPGGSVGRLLEFSITAPTNIRCPRPVAGADTTM